MVMLETIFKAVFLGVLNGLTEFLPVSSTGHLIVVEHILGVSQERFGLSFDAALHLGTAAAVIWVFWKRWMEIIEGLMTTVKKGEIVEKGRLGFFLLLATVPAALIGLKFEKIIESAFRKPSLVAAALIAGAIPIYLAENKGREKIKELSMIGGFKALIIGLAQSLALIPGVSRSGITISMGMFLGFSRQNSAEFAFLLSGPIVLGAGGKKFLDVIGEFFSGSVSLDEINFFILGIVSSALAGWLAIKFLLNYLNRHSLNIFVIYRIILAIFIFILIK